MNLDATGAPILTRGLGEARVRLVSAHKPRIGEERRRAEETPGRLVSSASNLVTAHCLAEMSPSLLADCGKGEVFGLGQPCAIRYIS